MRAQTRLPLGGHHGCAIEEYVEAWESGCEEPQIDTPCRYDPGTGIAVLGANAGYRLLQVHGVLAVETPPLGRRLSRESENLFDELVQALFGGRVEVPASASGGPSREDGHMRGNALTAEPDAK
jgi:hypothetical protein